MKKMFMSMKRLKKSIAPESFLNKVSSWRLATFEVYPVNVEQFSK